MKIICTKSEFAALVRNCADGECTQCALADACASCDKDKSNSTEYESATAEDLVSKIIMRGENT